MIPSLPVFSNNEGAKSDVSLGMSSLISGRIWSEGRGVRGRTDPRFKNEPLRCHIVSHTLVQVE